MHTLLGHAWWMLALRGAAGFVFGVLALAMPGLTLAFLVALYAAYAIVGGVGAISGAIRHRRDTPAWWVPLLLGLCSVAAGVIAIFLPAITALVLVLVMGVNAVATGVFDLITAFRLRGRFRGTWLLYLSGILSLVFGVLVLAWPGAGALALVWMIAAYTIFTGALLLVLGLSARGWLNDGLTPHPSAG